MRNCLSGNNTEGSTLRAFDKTIPWNLCGEREIMMISTKPAIWSA
jgi:hypothetical protein